MNKLKSSIASEITAYLLVTLGILCYTVGWSIFLMPNNLVGGGVSGLAAIIQYATGFNMGYTYLIVNVLLLLLAFKILGMGFGGKTIYAIGLASVLLKVLPGLIPEDFIIDFATSNGRLMCTIMGSIMSGLGIGIAMSHGGSTGGTDIVALIVNKYKNISPGKVILYVDVIIISLSLLVPSFDADGVAYPFVTKLATAAYGFILITVNSYVVDLYLAGSKQSVQIFIFSKFYDRIADSIAFDLKRGVTILPAQGWYTKNESKVVLVVIRKTDLNLLFRYVKAIDPDAFLSVSTVMGVYGQGFDSIKVSKEEVKKVENR
ncbi:MAG: YitT family protein [Bacteroidales bacterium]|nr:YitT family protein [Bacteroidales bacterium]